MAQNRNIHTRRAGSVSGSHQQFETELAVYESNRHTWVRSHEDEFVVISGSDVAGFYPTYGKAYEAAIHQLGFAGRFLIKEVTPHEHVFVVY